MRLRLFVFAPALALMTALVLGCGKKPDAQEPAPKNAPPGAASADVGSPLYAPAPVPEYPAPSGRNELLVIANALVQYDQRQIVSAEVDGTIELFARRIRDDEKVDPSKIVYHPRDFKKEFPLRRISDSDEVKDGDILAFMDDRQIDARIKGAAEIEAAAKTGVKYAAEGGRLAEERVKILTQSVGVGTGSQTELIDAQLTLARFRENEANAKQTIAKTSAEMKEMTVLLDRHRVKSRVNGIIRAIDKRPGAFLKAGEKIMEIEATDRVRIEGQLDVQYAKFVHRDMDVIVEPAVPSAPLADHTDHRRPVTGVAVTAHPDGPLVASVGGDGALVWDPNLGKKPNRSTVPHSLPHPVGVRSVAATPPAAKGLLVITGADDGRVRIWDVSNRDKLPTAPKAEPEEAHTAAVQSIAISPKGEFFATAAGRDVFVWDLAAAKKKYALPAEHRDNVTAVSFTPQNTLITTSKDGTVKVWKLGTERAAVVRTIDHRVGAVEVLGVSRDGARVLFDQDKNRIDLVDPAKGQTTGQIQNVSSAGAFASLAVFGYDETDLPADRVPTYSIATAGGDGELKGTLQYWLAPRAGGRGAEVGRLITPGRAPVTAAAFSPVRGEPFLVVGTSAGGVHLWKPPSEVSKKHTGKVVNIDATDTRYVTVRVELDNRELKLRDHSYATVIVPIDR